MKIIITGPTGTAGSEAIRICLADSSIEKVTALSRKPLPVQDGKLNNLIHDDYLDYSKILEDLKGHDACLWDLGVSQNQVTPEEYHKVTFDYALAGAKAMASVNPNFTFCFLSGQGADSSEKSRVLFARVKGETENALGKLGHPKVFSFRPGYIHSTNQPRDKRKGYDLFFGPLSPLFFILTPGMIINAADLAKAMVEVAKKGSDKTILHNKDIKRIADSVKA